MRQDVAGVLVGMTLLLAASWCYAPVRQCVRIGPAFDIALAEGKWGFTLDELEAFQSGERRGWHVLRRGIPTEWRGIWKRGSTRSPHHDYEMGWTIDWRWMAPTQALIFLIGGGLLTFVVRRDRRRRADGVPSA